MLNLKTTNKAKPNLYTGLATAAFTILLLQIYARVMPRGDLWIILLNELTAVLIALGMIRFCQLSPRDVLPAKVPTVRQLIGVLLLGVATLYIAAAISVVTIPLFSQTDMNAFRERLQKIIASTPLPLMLLILAALPAFCEEVLFRGFIQYSCSALKRRWMIPCVVGLLFGIVHFHLFRVLPTALIGIALSYIMLRTNNIVLPMIGHFLNNAIAASLMYWSTKTMITKPEIPQNGFSPDMLIFVLGLFLFFGSVLPFILYGSDVLLRKKDAAAKHKDAVIVCSVLASLLLLSGIALMTFSVKMTPLTLA